MINGTIKSTKTPAERVGKTLTSISNLSNLSGLAPNQRTAILAALQAETQRLTETFSNPTGNRRDFSLPAAL